MEKDIEAVHGQCHCGSVRFEARLADGLRNAIRCTCSLCRMRGAVMVFAGLDGFRIVSGEEALVSYRFNTGTARHYFCGRCGIYTHHQRRFDPRQYAINAACLEGISPFDFEEVAVVDGINHPHDCGGGPLQVAGILRFEPTRP